MSSFSYKKLIPLWGILSISTLQATFWQELKQCYPSKGDAVNFLELCIDEAAKKESESYIREFAWNLGQLVRNYPPHSCKWETVLIVLDVFIQEHMRHYAELRRVFLDKELFVKEIRERLAFLFEAGTSAVQPVAQQR